MSTKKTERKLFLSVKNTDIILVILVPSGTPTFRGGKGG